MINAHDRSDRRDFLKRAGLASAGILVTGNLLRAAEAAAKAGGDPTNNPNIVLFMTDDQGWGEAGYYNHPVLKTPNLDAMATDGLRFDRFYAGAPVCSPTRASVLTGRANDRCGVFDHGFPLRRQEKTVAQALRKKGYATAHFGKWHLDGLRGPGVPILKDDEHSPGVFGFDKWLSATNYIDLDPAMGRNGVPEGFKGTSSEVIVDEALKFIKEAKAEGKPFFAVIWDGTPHRPYIATAEDQKLFPNLDRSSKRHYAELAAFDRSLGVLRKNLREMGVADDTMLWFCSDNGGLAGDVNPGTVGGLRGHKGQIWEGGLRVPCVVEWPAVIKPRVTDYPASTMDIYPTIANILNLPKSDMIQPVDGVSLLPLFEHPIESRKKPIPFKHKNKAAFIDNDWKLVTENFKDGPYELYNLKADPNETKNVAKENPEVFARLKTEFDKWSASLAASVAGKDYPEGKVWDEPSPRGWKTDERYQAHFEEWAKRPEFKRINGYINKKKKKRKK